MASVRKRKHIYKGVQREAWVVDYVDQSGTRRLKTFRMKREADAYRLRVETEIDQGTHTPDRDSVRVKDLCNMYISDFEDRWNAKEITGNSFVSSRYQINKMIVPHLGKYLAKDLTREMVEAWVRQLRATYAPGTTRRVFGVLRQVLRFAVRKHYVKRCVIDDEKVRLPTMEQRKGFPSREQISVLLTSVRSHHHWEPFQSFVNNQVVVALGVFCGLRPGETCGLQWKDIDFAKGEIVISHSFSRYDGLKTPKTRAGERKIPLTDPVIDALQAVARWRRCVMMANEIGESASRRAVNARRRKLFQVGDVPTGFAGLTGFVLLNEAGGPVTAITLSKTWHKVMTRAGLIDAAKKPLFTPHMLRHVAASLFIEAGLPPMNIKQVMGHASVSTTFNVYGHLFPEDDRVSKAASAIAASFNATRDGHCIAK